MSPRIQKPENWNLLRPPLKWAGGKRWLVPYLKPYWKRHSHRRLVEPFCGGISVALGLLPGTALLNDVNPHLVNFFKWLSTGFKIDMEMRNDKTLYYRYRDEFNELAASGCFGTKRSAELFYFLNRTCYNGLCRFNKDGGFNVPFGSYRTINYMRDFAPYKNLFQGWEFVCMDFENVSLSPDDFIYADPPYDVEFTQYSGKGFSWDDQVRLAKWLSRHPGPVVLSNQATDRVTALYLELGFSLRYLEAPRMINCTGDRTKAKEVLALRGI